MSDEAILTEVRDGILIVTINRPITCGSVSGLGFEVTLPGTVVRTGGTIDSTCGTNNFPGGSGSNTAAKTARR